MSTSDSAACDPRYQLGPELGMGGGGVVHEGVRVFALGPHGTLTRACAIKLMYESQVADSAAVRRFTHEAMLGYELSVHPHLVATRDLGLATDGRPYLVMEHAGRTLDDLSEHTDGRLPIIRAIADAVLGALGYLHGHGLVHGDVHMGNIFVCQSGAIKLGDLGHAVPYASAGPKHQPREDLRRLGLVLHALLLGWDRQYEPDTGLLRPLPDSTPPELFALVQRLLPPRQDPAGAERTDALSADELRALLRASQTEIARPEAIAAWLAACEREHLGGEDDDRDGEHSSGDSGDSPGGAPVRADTGTASDAAPTLDLAKTPAEPDDDPGDDPAGTPEPRSAARTRSHLLWALVAAASLFIGYTAGQWPAGSQDSSTRHHARPSTTQAAALLTLDAQPAPDAAPALTTPTVSEHVHIIDRERPEIARLASHDEPATDAPGETQDTNQQATPRWRGDSRQFVAGTDRLSFAGRAQNRAGIRVAVDRGQWLEHGHALVRVFLDNNSDTLYRLAHARLLDPAHGRSASVRFEYFTPGADKDSSVIAMIPAHEIGQGALLIEHASRFSGRSMVLVFSEPGHERSVELVLEWP